MQRNQLNTTNMTLEELKETANNNEFHKYINTHMSCDTNKLRLKSHKDCDFDVNYAILKLNAKIELRKNYPNYSTNIISYFRTHFQLNNAQQKVLPNSMLLC